MKEPMPPCLYCCAREVGCHDKCKPYQEFKKELKTYKKKITEEKTQENVMEGIEINRYRR